MISSSRVREIVAGVIGLEVSMLDESAELGVTAGWDSIAQLEILEKLETEAGKRISSEEVLLTENLQDLIRVFSV